MTSEYTNTMLIISLITIASILLLQLLTWVLASVHPEHHHING